MARSPEEQEWLNTLYNQERARVNKYFSTEHPIGSVMPPNYGRQKAIAGDIRYDTRSAGAFPRLAERGMNRFDPGKAALSTAGAGILAGALTAGLIKLLKKRESDAKPASEDSKRRAPIVSRRPKRGRVSGRTAYKKGGVVKRKGVKKAGRKKVHKKAGKR